MREKPREFRQGIFYYQLDVYSDYSVKCYKSIGISLKHWSSNQFILRFSFASLIKLLRKRIVDRNMDLCYWAERTVRGNEQDEENTKERPGNCELIQLP